MTEMEEFGDKQKQDIDGEYTVSTINNVSEFMKQ